MIVAARPTLKARISARPKPTRCSAIAARRTTSADGHGSRPGGDADAEEPSAVDSLVVVVVVVVVRDRGRGGGAVIVMVVRAAARSRREQHRGADADDEQTRDERQPRIERLGDDEPGEEQRDETEREDAGRVGHGHDRAEEHGVAGPALRPDEIAGDDRLAVSRRERVRGAPEGGEREREQDRAEREVAAGNQRLEAAALVRGGAAASSEGGVPGPRPSAKRAVAADTSSGERRRSCGYARSSSLVLSAGTLAPRSSAPSRASHDDLAPADPRAEVAVAERERRPRPGAAS